MGYISFDEQRVMDIVLLGRIAVDFNPVDYFQTLAESTTFKKYLGGSPANIAVGMQRLGHCVGFLGKISADRLGDFVQNFFEKEGIDTSHITRCENGESIGLTFTEILSKDESSILMFRENVADLQLHPDDIDEAYIKNTKMLLISGTALSQSPSREAALKAVLLAKKTNTPIVFDADYRAYTWKNQDEISVYTSLVARESSIILGSREEYDLMERLIDLNGTDEDSSTYWLGAGAKIVIIKHGKKGSTAYTKEGAFTIKPFPVEALKGFGGGDGYASAFLHGLLSGWPIIDALEFGSASAAMLVASHACSVDMPSASAIKAFIEEKKSQYGDMVARGK